MRRILVALVAILAVIVLAVSYLGLFQVPLLSAAFGMDKPRDLGMTVDQPSYDALVAKYGIEMPSPKGDYTLSAAHHWSGSFEFDGTVKAATIAAIRELQAPDSRLRDVQFRITPGQVELSAFVNVPGYPLSGPVYGRFGVQRTGPQSVAIDIRALEFGRVGIPSNISDDVKSKLATYVNLKLVEAGVRIDTLELGDGTVRFKGALPKTTKVDPPAAGNWP